MRAILTTGLIMIGLGMGCAQPDPRLHSRRCKTEACLAAKKAILEKAKEPEKPVAEKPVAQVEAKELQDKIIAERKYFQSRSVITLKPVDNLLTANDEYSLVNATSKKTLIERQAVASSIGLTNSDYFFKLSETADESFALKLFPALSDSDYFHYGPNSLRLWINSAEEQKFSLIEIWLKDFDLMEPTLSTLPSDSEASDGFEGWVNTVNLPHVQTADSSLRIGLSNIVND